MEAVFYVRKDLNSHCLYKGSYIRGVKRAARGPQAIRHFILCSPYTNFTLITGYGLLFFEFKAGVADSGRHVEWRLNCYGGS